MARKFMGMKLLFALFLAVFLLQVAPAVPVAKAETDWTGYIAISDKAGLDSVRNDLSGKYYLTANIVFTSADFANGSAFYNEDTGWQPIGSSFEQAFTGTFDGNGHTISGLYCNSTSSTANVYCGLFGYNQGTIQNLGMVNDNINVTTTATGHSYAGSVSAYNFGGTISNCYNNGNVSSSSASSYSFAGGIVGYDGTGTISNCYNTGNVNGGYYAGGIVGASNDTISNCDNTGNVSGSLAGGIVGDNQLGTISNCYNTGIVNGSVAGGIVGHIDSGTGINCYNTGSVSSSSSSFYCFAGGIVGASYHGTITNCYNTGNVSGGSAGGIAGESYFLTISNCYFLNNSSIGVGYIYGGSVTTTSLTLDQMKQQASYVGFDFTNTWSMSSFLPYLQAIPYASLNSVSFDARNVQIGTNGTYNSRLVFNPSLPTFSNFQFTSLDTSIATVDQNGVINGIKIGTTNIIAKDLITNKTAICTVTVKQGVTGITITGSSSVNANSSTQLVATVSPSSAGNTVVSWSSANNNIATVDQKGLVTPHMGGTVTIYATSTDGTNIKVSFTLTVIRHAQSVSLDQSSISLLNGQTKTLVATVLPTDTTNKNVTWSSSNTAVATVNFSGTVTAKSRGTAIITATTADGGFHAPCTVTVIQPVIGVSFARTTENMGVGGSIQLVPIFNPTNANNQAVSWTPSDPCVTVENDGTITGVSTGTSVITVTTDDGSKTAMCIVNVGNAVTDIGLNKTQTTLIEGLAEILTVSSILPADAINKTVAWQSSNVSVATVDASGKVTGLKPGTATIACMATDGSGVLASCAITVNAKSLISIAVTTKPTKLVYTQMATLNTTGMVLTLTYDNGTTATITTGWQTSYNFSVSGTRTVTVQYGGRSATFNVTVNPFVVSFNANGGSAVASKTANYNTTITAPTAPTRTGYTFGGWYKEAACTNAWNFTTNTVTSSITLWAKWIPINYTIKFYCGTTLLNTLSLPYSSTITYAPAKTGCTFAGWYTSTAFTTKVTKVDATNINLYGKWTATVAFNSQGGTAVTSKTANYNTLITAPTAPTRAGYKFVGWYKESACTIAWNFTTEKVTTATTLWAKWLSITAPTLQAASVSYNSIKLTWTAVPGATCYAVYKTTSTGSLPVLLYKSTTPVTSYTVGNLTTGTVCYYRVLAYAGSVSGTYSVVVSGKPVPATPVANATRVSSTSIKVSWAAIAGATGYEVYNSTASTSGYVLAKTVAASTPYYTNTGLMTGKTYYFKVRAYCLVGTTKVYGSYSAVVYAKP